MSRKLKILLFSTLFPSRVRPGHGIFVETRLRELLKYEEIEAKVVAPVPWFPFSHDIFGEYAQFSITPDFEHRNGLDVFHPRFFLPPKIGMNIAPYTLALGALPVIRKLIQDGFDFDLIDAHYFYPDGVAAGLLAKWLKKPFVVTARGSDINLIAKFRIPRGLMLRTAERAEASIVVSSSLGEGLEKLGAERAKIKVFRNGVDLARFRPVPRDVARAQLGWPDGPTLISVGNLVENKGHHIAIESLKDLVDFRLVIVGDGPQSASLTKLASRIGVAERVLMAGRIPQSQLPIYYSAADILVLASASEGWANVLLEAMACGTPVVATAIPGTKEVIAVEEVGYLFQDRSPAGLVKAVSEFAPDTPDQATVRKYAESFSWDETSRAQLELFTKILNA